MTGRLRVAVHGGVATVAAATALSAVFSGYGWFWPIVGAVIVVVAVSELVRWSPVPSGLGPLVTAGAVTCYLTAVFTPAHAHGDVIPSGASLRALGDLTRAAFHDVRVLSTPVPDHRGLVLIATVGLAAVALVVDLVAATMRRAAVAGLPLLAVFALATSVAKHGVGWVPFVFATAAYLWLLLADSRDRLSRWGRPLGVDRDSRPRFSWSDQDVSPSPLSVMGRRIGFTAIAIGVVVPLLIPGLHGGVPHGSGNGGLGLGGGHGSTRVTLNPIVRIQAELSSSVTRNVMSVQTTDQQPGYLRLTSLDQFDGTAFSPAILRAGVAARVTNGIVAPVVTGATVSSEITVDDLSTPWLPVPDQIESVEVSGDWRYDRPSNTIFSAENDTHGLQYRTTSLHPNWTAAELEQATATDPALAADTQVPTSVSAQVIAKTRSVIAAARTPYDAAVAIQAFLTSAPFVYDQTAQTAGVDPLARFLLGTHRGFCQQYATAMAAMARIAGIPARVAVGFTRGEQQPDRSWLVTTKDAHAWPELYFTGIGWVPFEPTPRTDGQAITPAYSLPHQTGGKGQGPGSGKNGANGGKHSKSPLGPDGLPKNQRFDHDSSRTGVGGGAAAAAPRPHHNHLRILVGWVALGLLAVALVAPVTARLVTRRRRWRRPRTAAERATAAWAELRASAIDARAGWVDGLSPRATARVLRAEGGGLSTGELRALDRLVEAVQRAWYSPDGASVRADTLEDDVDDLRAAMLSEATTWERLALRLWPRSTLREARAALERVGDLLDAADLAAARLRARLRLRQATT